MNLQRTIVHAYLYVPYFFHKITGTGAFGRQKAEYLPDPVQTGGNAIKAALLTHHVKQFHESSCSVATVVSVVNTIRALKGDDHTPISQMDILEKVQTGNWKERMSENGYNGKRGLPLPLLGKIVKSSLDAYGLPYKAVETIPVHKKFGQLGKIKKDLQNRLVDFETKGNCLIIAHFDQGAFVPGLNIPHISPVGGFDTQSGNVTILDVDTEQEKPYRITFNTFCKGLGSYTHVLKLFGYQSGGYVFIKLL
jgi:hypothetical protein